MITAWRVVDPAFAETAFTGEGPRLRGARWNPPGMPIVYTASSISLATLEIVVHNQRALRVPEYTIISCSFPEAIVETLDRRRLPANWRDYPPPIELQRIGAEWLDSKESVVLEVPSAVIEQEVNYLLNPLHPDFASVDVGEPRSFRLDPRLIT